MIYTVTLNPAIDYIVGVEGFRSGQLNRTSSELILPGGKGINVSIVLGALGTASTATGFVAGDTGHMLEGLLGNYGIDTDFIPVSEGNTRINVKLRNLLKADGKGFSLSDETEVNGQGPTINQNELEQLMEKLESLSDGDILVLSGSIPRSVPTSIYKDILNRVNSRNIITIVDAGKDLLRDVLEHRPTLIKPNHIELGELFDVVIEDKASAILYAHKLQKMGAKNVLVSMAGDGAVLVAEDGRDYVMDAPKGQVVNSVGAGDSMVAGFIYGMERSDVNIDYEMALKYGLAAGSASAFSEGLASGKAIIDIYNRL